MTRLDRYILGHLIATCGFLLLVLTGVVWLTQAVRLIDTAIASGQGALSFLALSVLVLPQVFVIVLPLSGIGAALYTINKLYSDCELIVMMAAGLSPFGLMRPLATFGALIGATTAGVLIVLAPIAVSTLADRTQAIRSELANALLVERQFLHPVPGVTLFISDAARGGEMSGIFLDDERVVLRPVTYSAERARLVREGMKAGLVMQDGIALSLNDRSQQLDTLKFDQFVFDLSDLISKQSAPAPRPSEYSILKLIAPTPEMLASGRYKTGNFVAEGHYKLAQPLLAAIFPMIALVTMLVGGYRRSGIGRRAIVAILVASVLQIITFEAQAAVKESPALWPLMYLPILLGIGYIGLLLLRLGRARRRWPKLAT